MKTTRTEINSEEFRSNSNFLTADNVNSLIGKIVDWTYPCASENVQYVYRSQFAEVISEFELAARIPEDGEYATRAARWEARMSPRQLEEMKSTMVVIDSDGESTGIKMYPGDEHFTCSDEDRYVSFIVESAEEKTEQTRKAIGTTIRQLRELKGMTLVDMAERTGVAFNRIAEIEKERYSAGIDVLSRILAGVGAHLEVVSEDTDYRKWSASPITKLQYLAEYLNHSREWPVEVDAEFFKVRGWKNLMGNGSDICRNEKELLTRDDSGEYVIVRLDR